jgi:phage shock protein C
MNPIKKIYRSQTDRVLAGVCGGLAEYFKVDPALVRIIWILVTLFGGSGILAYIVALFILPQEFEVKGETPPTKKDHQLQPIWGLLLIVLGIVLLIQHSDIVGLAWSKFWSSGLNIFLGLFVIALGIYMIVTKKSDLSGIFDVKSTYPLHLSLDNKQIAGVCGGIGETLVIDPTLIRFLWVFGTLLSAGIGIILYIVLSLILPQETPISEE